MRILNLLCLLVCVSVAEAGQQPGQSDASYEAAVRNRSTSPSYVMVTVVDTETGEARPTCTGANFLLGAIHIEGDIAYDREGEAKAMQIALQNQTHTFKFSKQKALHNVERHYTDYELARVRMALQGRTVPEALDALNHDRALTELVHGASWVERYSVLQDAAACVLMERGESPRIADITGQLFIVH